MEAVYFVSLQYMVLHSPQAIAVACEEETIMYDELNRKFNRLVHYLQKRGVKQETLVGLLLLMKICQGQILLLDKTNLTIIIRNIKEIVLLDFYEGQTLNNYQGCPQACK